MNCAFLLGFFLFGSGPPMATHSPGAHVFHGIHVEVSAQGGILVARAYYDGGTPVVDGEVTISPPGSEEAWQTGRTDPSGRFAFLPDAPGPWTVQVDDGGGHRGRTTFDVGAGEAPAGPEGEAPAGPKGEAAAGPQGQARLWQLLTGLGLIAGMTGAAYGYTARRKGRDEG
jgi:nickel transport protein